jgi:hypothetical protein
MSDPTPEWRGEPVQRHEEPTGAGGRLRILRVPSGGAALQRVLGDGYHVFGADSAEVPDIVVADLASVDQLGELHDHPGKALVIRLPFGATVAEVVRVLDSGVDYCLVDGPIEILAAQVRSVDRALRWRKGG